MFLNQISGQTTTIDWLLQQAPVVIVMGFAIWWLASKLSKKDSQLIEITKETIKLAALWEGASKKFSEGRENFKPVLDNLVKHQEGLIAKIDELLELEKGEISRDLLEIKDKLEKLKPDKGK